ncbi:MAG: hypothetical protein ACE141_09505 [Bryobacteraceae bacterium]
MWRHLIRWHLAAIAVCCTFCPLSAFAGISPSITEINLGSFPVDQYSTNVMNNGIFPNCPSDVSVRDCVKRWFNNNPGFGTVYPGNYVSQGVTGVRFFFALGGGGGTGAGGTSTPFNADGSVRSAWLTNLSNFFYDLKQSGILRVTPMPVMTGIWSGTGSLAAEPAQRDSCGTEDKTLYFFKWLPFGLEYHADANDYWPDEKDNNDAYNCAAANDVNFWGWSKLFNLIDQILAKAQLRQLTVEEFELENEVDLFYFTVQARLIYDNTTNTKVIESIGEKMSAHGFSSRRVTVSAGVHRSADENGGHCGSYYGDSAMILGTSELLAAFGGAKIGAPAHVDWLYNELLLPCDGSLPYCGPPGSPGWYECVTGTMVEVPVTQAVPTVTDMHSTMCVLNYPGGDCAWSVPSAATAKTLYDDVYSYLYYRGLLANRVVFGETNPTQVSGVSCDDIPAAYVAARAQDNVDGYKNLTSPPERLYQLDASNVTMRVWNNTRLDCYPQPMQVNPPYGP